MHSVHDVGSRKMGKMCNVIVVGAHFEVDATISVEQDHAIAVAEPQRVRPRQRVLHRMTHVDSWRRPVLDHAAPAVQRAP